jgi:hypothetical protein
MLSTYSFAGTSNKSQDYNDQALMETWMNSWMGSTKLPVGTLHLSRFQNPVYFLTKPISWKPNGSNIPYKEVTVPKGFVTDFASIPKVFWSLLRPDGEYTYAAIIHDYLYWTQTRSREESDQIFKLVMRDFSVDSIKAEAIFSIVRFGGGYAWKNNQEAIKNGEKRMLKKFPQDPRITWEEWKERPDVF